MPGGLQSLMKFPVIFYFNVEILHLFLKAPPKESTIWARAQCLLPCAE